ncbi:MAG: 3-oxoacyl-ACP synthase [Kibdelosporangium sp.]
MTALAVRAVADYLPDHRTPITDLPELAALPAAAEATFLNLGIDTVHDDPALSPADLAAGAARRALAEAELSPQDVHALIVVESRAPDRLLSSEATRVQQMIGAHDALTFTVGGVGCVSITPALLTARGLLAAQDDIENVLVVHGSKPATPRRYRHPVTVSGDGGQAVLLGRTGPVRILDILQQTNGEYWDLFSVDYRDRAVADWSEECSDIQRYSFRLAVETRNRLRTLHDRLLTRNGMTVADVGLHLSQNLSTGSFRFVEESLDITLGKACQANLRQYGHLGPNDVLLNLRTSIAAGDLAEGRRAVLLNTSPVAAWSLLLVEHGEGGGQEYYL